MRRRLIRSPMRRYSRYIVLFGGAFGCVAVNAWLIKTGHYRWPLVVLFAYVFGAPLIIRKLPPVTTDPQKIRTQQRKAARSARRLGWIYLVGLVLGTVDFFTGGAKGIPWWGVVLLIGWSGFLTWSTFTIAKRLGKASAAGQPDTPIEPE